MSVNDSGQGKMTYGGIVSKLKVILTAVVFIRVVPAVIVIVTLPAARHTAVVLTSELVWLTRPLSCPSHKIIIANKIKNRENIYREIFYLKKENNIYHTPLSVHLMHRRSHPRRHTSSERECSGQSLCIGTRPHHRSFGLQRETYGRQLHLKLIMMTQNKQHAE